MLTNTEQQSDTVRRWKPNLKQVKFMSLPDTIFEALYGGAAGGGKTEVLLMMFIAKQYHKIPRVKGILLRRTFPELEGEVVPRSQDYYPITGAEYDKAKHIWTWPSGATLKFGHAENEDDIRKYDSSEFQYAAFDELTSFTQFQYNYIVSTRLRSSIPGIIPIARSGSNPGNIGHGWVRDYFVEPCKEGGKILVNKVTKQKRIFIPAKLEDNTDLIKTDPTYRNRLEGLTNEAERRAKLYGDWYTFTGQVFKFRNEPMPDEPDNARHVIEPFEIPNWWTKIRALDWGQAAMTYCVWAAISPWKRVYIYREYSPKIGTLISDWGSDISRLSQGEVYKDSVIDPSSRVRDKKDNESILSQVNTHTGYNWSLADNDRISGKTLCEDYLRWWQKPISYVPPEGYKEDTANDILRKQGVYARDEYIKMFLPQAEETGLPRLQIFKTCPILIKTIPLCTYDKNNTEDVQDFDGDDPYDAWRYLIKRCHLYLSSTEKIAAQDEAKGLVIQKLEKTGDMTDFYMSMARIDGAKSNIAAMNVRGKYNFLPVRKVHGGLRRHA